jgi:hypothetical protein
VPHDGEVNFEIFRRASACRHPGDGQADLLFVSYGLTRSDAVQQPRRHGYDDILSVNFPTRDQVMVNVDEGRPFSRREEQTVDGAEHHAGSGVRWLRHRHGPIIPEHDWPCRG